MNKTYRYAVLGGTFDHLHKGHKKLINEAFKQSKFVTIGLVKENLYRKKFLANHVELYNLRKKHLINYLKSKFFFKRARIITISDIFGTTLQDEKLETIFVTKDTRTNALKINDERIKRSLKPLEIITIPFVLAQDGKPITSERIRSGEIDREGHNFQFPISPSASSGSRAKSRDNFQKEALRLPENLRTRLQKPLGKLIEGNEAELQKATITLHHCFNKVKYPMVIAVGDIISASLELVGLLPDVKIIDWRSRRKDISGKLDTVQASSLSNEPGTINIKTALVIKKAISVFLKIKKKQTIIVQGEEDLLALPAILFAPLGSIVLYGQMDRGVIEVEVTEKKKKEIIEILKKFD